jgi:hypothetical protein
VIYTLYHISDEFKLPIACIAATRINKIGKQQHDYIRLEKYLCIDLAVKRKFEGHNFYLQTISVWTSKTISVLITGLFHLYNNCYGAKNPK